MLSEPQSYIMVTLVTVLLYWAIPAVCPLLRMSFLIFVSALFLFEVSPIALAWSVGFTLVAYITARVMRRGLSQRAKRAVCLMGVVVIVAAAVCIQLWAALISDYMRLLYGEKLLVTLGLPYLTLKVVATMVDYCQQPSLPDPSLPQVLLLNIFFPIYGAGPIERMESMARDQFSRRFDLDAFTKGLSRFLLGIFKIFFLYSVIVDGYLKRNFADFFARPETASTTSAYIFIWVSLLNLYINFSGYSDIALGTGGMINLKLSENFNYPLLATNLQSFWKRWHISLANFSFRYVFFPLVKISRKSNLSIFVTFVMIGLWHSLSAGFLTWGVFHGLGMVVSSRFGAWGATRPLYRRFRTSWIGIFVSWFLTMTFISWTWSISNCVSRNDVFVLTFKLMGM